MYSKSLLAFFSCLFLHFTVNAAVVQTENITGFSPTSICAGSSTTIQVNGSGFLNATGVKIGVTSVAYNTIDDNTILITNTNGASTGIIFVEATTTLNSPNQLIITTLNPNLTSTPSGIICENTSITYTATGGSFYEFFIDGSSTGLSSADNSITFTPTQGQNIHAKVFDASRNCSSFTNVITAQIQPISTPILVSSNANISVCNNEPLASSIIYQLTAGATDAFITGLPAGVTAEISGNNVIISGTPNVATAQGYNYVVTPVGVSCATSEYGTISVTFDAELNRILSSGDSAQMLCEGEPIEPIAFSVGGGATNAAVTGLPNGLTSNYDVAAKVLSIEGTPSDDITLEQTYSYTVTTSGSNCNEKLLRGTITVQPLAQLTVLASSGSLDQMLCEGVAIDPILIELQGGADLISVSGLPNGINYSLDATTQVATIYGTPLGPVDTIEEYSYVVSSISEHCSETTLQGKFSVNGDSSLAHISSSGDTSQVLCEESPLVPISFSVGGGATNAAVTGLPNGLTSNYDVAAKVLSIEGTPSDDITLEQTYSYTVTTSGSNCNEKLLRGTITVQPLAQLTVLASSGSLDQVLCEGVAIDPILIKLQGGADLVNVSGLPNGVNYSLDATTQVATIYGTPLGLTDAFNDYPFVVSSISEHCSETTLQGNFRVNGDSSLSHISTSGASSQLLCEESTLDPITFSVGGGATNASVTGLPNGVSFNYDAAAKILTIEGKPSDNITEDQTYSYAVTTNGSNCNEQVYRGTISVQPLAQLTLLASSGSLDQILCEGEAIAPILIELQGGETITNVSGLPNGVSYSFNDVTKLLTVEGTPTENISSNKNSLISFAVATSCNTAYLTGFLQRIPQPTVELISHLQTQNQLVCGVTPIEKIEYRLIDGANTVDITGLPPGVNWTLSGMNIEISGVPEDVVYETNFEYSISVEGNGCSSVSTSAIIVTPNTMDMPTAEPQQYFCIYDAPTISDIEVYANNLKWYSENGLDVLDPDTPLVDGETYYAHNELIVSESSSIDRYACRSFPTAIQVFVQDTPAPQILEPNNIYCLDGEYILDDIKTSVAQVVWYSTATSDNPLSIETPLESMTYYAATIDDQTGCESTLRTTFEVFVQPCTVKVYNALSVNGDGLNEKLIIDNISYFAENELVIYNRNGRVVYKTSNYGSNNNFFEGYSNINGTLGDTKILPMGTYYYTFSYIKPLDGQLITTNGFINLVTN